MAGIKVKNKKKQLTKLDAVDMTKIGVFLKKPVLKQILKILTMEHGGFRTMKSVKNIHRLVTNLDLSKYKTVPESLAYIWCIKYFSIKWLNGIVHPELIEEMAKQHPEYDNLKGEIIRKSIEDKSVVTAPEAKAIFDLIGEYLQMGFMVSLKDEYISLLDDIDMDQPGAFKELSDRLFLISNSLLDIKHNTNLVSNKITFNTADMNSLREAIGQTIKSLSSTSNMLKVGIKRWNTLLSPAYMNGRLYVYAGAPASGKSLILEKTAFDIRKYNPGYVSRTPGMKPCVLYISMENMFTECIERVWNMSFDDSITDYSIDEACEKLCKELGIAQILNDDIKVTEKDEHGSTIRTLRGELLKENVDEPNIEVVLKYFPYRSISTDDLYSIIHDLRDENLECCALVFDYIKRIEPSVPTPESVKLELNHIMNELKALAVRCDIPVITAHQLNRAAASAMDALTRQGRGDVIKAAGREHIGDAYEVLEIADWLALTNIEFKPGTMDRYITMSVEKRRRIDPSEPELAKYTYLAHPFSKTNGLRLLDDMNLNKVLSLQSLSTDITGIGTEKANAVPRLKVLKPKEFDELGYDDI